MVDLISLHLPKTGGISLRKTLQRRFPGAVNFDYPPAGYSRFPSKFKTTLDHFRNRLNPPKSTCIHGHFPAARYSGTGAKMIVFVRDPIELRASIWHFVHRKVEQQGARNATWRLALSMPLEQFILHGSTTYRFYFWKTDMSRFAFIGEMGSFEADLERLSNRLDVPFVSERENVNPSGSTYQFGAKLLDEFRRENQAEYAIYEAALRRRDEVLNQDKASVWF